MKSSAVRTSQRGNSNSRGYSTTKHTSIAVREEEDAKPSPVTNSSIAARISSDTAQEVVQEEATPDAYLPPGWMVQKVEPDW